MEGSERELFEQSLRQATDRHSGPALDAALTDIGWPDALAVEPHLAVATLFPLQGTANAISSALDWVMAGALGLDGRGPPAVVLPAAGSRDEPGRLTSDRLVLRGLGTPALQRADRVVVAAAGTIWGCSQAALTLRPIKGVDPAFGLVEVSGDGLANDPLPLEAGRTWGSAISLAQLALAHELTGAAAKMLELARQHALDRVQFGQPIARFQAVRHRLAEALVAIESAKGVIAAAWETPSPVLCAAAKALAGRGALTAARHCQQVLAGIGFTAEHPFHLYFRRVLLLDQLVGSSRSLTEALGRDLLATGRLPVLMPL